MAEDLEPICLPSSIARVTLPGQYLWRRAVTHLIPPQAHINGLRSLAPLADNSSGDTSIDYLGSTPLPLILLRSLGRLRYRQLGWY